MTLSENQKAWIASSFQTFLATALTVIGSTIASGVEWTTAFWIGVLITAVRAAVKAVFAQTSIPILGGKN